MTFPTTADELFPLVAGLPKQERLRLLQLMAQKSLADDAPIYRSTPPQKDEFGSDENALEWEAEGWEEFD